MTKSDLKKDIGSSLEDSNENDVDVKKESIEDRLKASEDKILRSLAEMENQRRRFEKERNEAFEFGGFNFARESLPLLDNFERAITSFQNDEKFKVNNDFDEIIDGMEIIKKDIISIFKKNGIEVIESLNKKFDPNFHQAMLEVEDNSKESGLVVQEIQKGYMMKGRLLRPSMVGVTKKNVKNSEKDADKAKKSEEK
jgi:molecular chaperone GrpE